MGVGVGWALCREEADLEAPPMVGTEGVVRAWWGVEAAQSGERAR